MFGYFSLQAMRFQFLSNCNIDSYLCLQTTATALGWALYYFAKNPKFQQTAREEVDSILGKDPANHGKIPICILFPYLVGHLLH
jgi:hypothetical protein